MSAAGYPRLRTRLTESLGIEQRITQKDMSACGRVAFEAAGVTVRHQPTSVCETLRVQAKGVEVVSIHSVECAGHPGGDDIAGLVPPVAMATPDSLVLASGGTADRRDLVSALPVGADRVNMDSRHHRACEAIGHLDIQKRTVENAERNSDLVPRHLWSTARGVINEVGRRVGDRLNTGAELTEIQDLVSGAPSWAVDIGGDSEADAWGVNQRLVRDTPTAAELLDPVTLQATSLMRRRPASLTQVAA